MDVAVLFAADGAEAFRLISAIAPSADGKASADSLFIVGDAHQRIYEGKSSMSKCGIDVRGRSRKLKICYRTSDERSGCGQWP
jgi:hypothetical protein